MTKAALFAVDISDNVCPGMAGAAGAAPREVGCYMTVGGRGLLAPMADRAGGGAAMSGDDILHGLGWAAGIAGQPGRGVTGGAVATMFGQNGVPGAEILAGKIVARRTARARGGLGQVSWL